MYTILDLKDALFRIFAERPPKKALTVQKICLVLADFYDCQPENISISELKAALRELTFAVPQSKLRGSDHVNWFFIKHPKATTVPVEKSAKITRRYHDKPLIQSQRLKVSK